MEKLFGILGKLLTGTIFLAIVLGAGYYIGSTKYKKTSVTPSPTTSQVARHTQAAQKVTPTQTPIPSPSPTVSSKKTISGGLSGATSFSDYTVQVPNGWNDKKESTPGVIDKLILSKGDYVVSVYQAAIGGGGCLYPGDADAIMAQKFTDFVGINGQENQYRRSWNKDNSKSTISYTICQKANDNSYGSPTKFGAISVQSPNPGDESTLAEIDSIIASLQKK